MSTSLLYHLWGVKDYTQRCIKFEGGAVWFHVDKKPAKRVCPRCGSANCILAGLVSPPPCLKTTPAGKKTVWLVLHLHRLECNDCGAILQEDRIIADPKKHYTHLLAQYALDMCRRTTIADVADAVGLSWDAVKDIVMTDLTDRKRKVERIDWRGVKRIAIDEISIRKGQKYLTVVMNLDTGRVLYVADGRKAEGLAPFFKILRRKRTKLEAIAMDMCDAFKLAVKLYYRRPCPIVYDRFHVTKMMNEVIDDIRREEMRNAESDEQRGVLKGQRYLLLYALENLEQSKVERLVALLKANERLSTSYILKEQLRLFWTQESRQAGETFLLDWIATAEASGIRQLKRFAKTLRDRWEGLLTYFDHRISSGPMEGTNTSIRNLMRKAYGFRDVEFLKLRILFIHECSVKFANA
jgi:transposase